MKPNLITAMADDAIDSMRTVDALNPDQAFFIYCAPGATHAPHHPTPKWIEKISKMHLFDEGWHKLRETQHQGHACAVGQQRNGRQGSRIVAVGTV
jgi:arylsulfatase A-like enzyme